MTLTPPQVTRLHIDIPEAVIFEPFLETVWYHSIKAHNYDVLQKNPKDIPKAKTPHSTKKPSHYIKHGPLPHKPLTYPNIQSYFLL